MPEIKDSNYFRPQDIKDLWLKTRKEGLHGTDHPGFFKTVNFSTDRNWFLIALTIELLAVIITIQGGVTRASLGGGAMYIFGAVAAVLIFIALDFIGTKWHHSPVGNKQLYKCELALLELKSEYERKRRGILDQLSKKSILKTLGVLLIILSALLKLFALFLLGTLGMVIVAVMTLLYLLVIYIHLFHTGYWFYEYILNKKIQSQHKQWRDYNRLKSIKDESEAIRHKGRSYEIPDKPEKKSFSVKEPLWDHTEGDEFTEITSGLHKLTFVKMKDNMYNYAITTRGIFTDEDIEDFINSGNEINRNIVALYSLERQLEQKITSK